MIDDADEVVVLEDVSSIRKKIEDILRPFYGYTRCAYANSIDSLRRVARVMAEVSIEHFDATVANAALTGAPVMQVHQSDGFGVDLMAATGAEFAGATLRRSGRYRAELLMELLILRTVLPSGEHMKSMRFYAPRRMNGKKGWHIFASSLDCPSLAWRRGLQRNIKIEVFLQDGLHATGMRNKHVAWSSLIHEREDDGEEDSPLARAHLHWCFGWRCVVHIAQSACKWALGPVLSETISHDAHCAVLALQNSSEPFHRRLDEFIYTRLFYDFDTPDEAHARLFWQTLGVMDEKQLLAIVEVSPRWDPEMKCLRVLGSVQSDADSFTKIRAVVLFCLRWRNWSDTRWLAMGTCSQLLLRSRAVGIDQLAAMVASTEGSTNDRHNIHGYKRFGTKDANTAFLVGALALSPLQWFLEQMLEDDRFLLHAKTFKEGIMQKTRRCIRCRIGCGAGCSLSVASAATRLLRISDIPVSSAC